jgi:hypothetical protein
VRKVTPYVTTLQVMKVSPYATILQVRKVTPYATTLQVMKDLASLKRKFTWLADFSDSFIRGQSTEALLKMETTSMKMKMMERKQDLDEKLASNMMELAERVVKVNAGEDNRWTILHDARFLVMGHAPFGSYDLGAVGMGGLVTSRGWVELHNPSSCKLSLRMFSINNCSATAGSSKMEGKEGYLDEIVELGDFKLTLRALRVAASFEVPWNMSYLALENFLLLSNFCSADFGPAENQALCLTQQQVEGLRAFP